MQDAPKTQQELEAQALQQMHLGSQSELPVQQHDESTDQQTDQQQQQELLQQQQLAQQQLAQQQYAQLIEQQQQAIAAYIQQAQASGQSVDMNALQAYFQQQYAAMGIHPQMLMTPQVLQAYSQFGRPNEVVEEEPIYVNAKQYHRILIRREQRAKLERQHKLTKQRRPYLHQSRHNHAKNRKRGPNGRFMSKKEREALEQQEQLQKQQQQQQQQQQQMQLNAQNKPHEAQDSPHKITKQTKTHYDNPTLTEVSSVVASHLQNVQQPISEQTMVVPTPEQATPTVE